MKMKKIEAGQTLIETLAALAIISIVISAIAVAVTTSLSNASFNKNQTLATKYAQQGMEIVQQKRDQDYKTFATLGGSSVYYCLDKRQNWTSQATPCTIPNVDTFIRSVQIIQGGCAANVARVSVAVKFTDGKCTQPSNLYCHKQEAISCLSTKNPVQLP